MDLKVVNVYKIIGQSERQILMDIVVGGLVTEVGKGDIT